LQTEDWIPGEHVTPEEHPAVFSAVSIAPVHDVGHVSIVIAKEKEGRRKAKNEKAIIKTLNFPNTLFSILFSPF
jgi:hypothetical protein